MARLVLHVISDDVDLRAPVALDDAGLALASIVQTATTIIQGIRDRKVLWRSVFNITQYAICLGAAYLCLSAFGFHGSIESPAPIDALALPAVLVAGLVGLLINTILVGTSIALHLRTSWWREVIVDIGPLAPLNDAASIAMAPLVVLAAERSPWLVPLLLVPLLALYKNTLASSALKHQAGHDALTSLANRVHLEERALQVLADGNAPTSVVGLLVIDLDRFKEINDTLGHRAGDRILQAIGDRLKASVRPVDLVARLGGDEFAVLLPDLADESAARAVASRILVAIREPIRVEEKLVAVDGSLGIALSPEHGTDFETLMRHADLAMYSAKQLGTSPQTFSAELTAGTAAALDLAHDLVPRQWMPRPSSAD